MAFTIIKKQLRFSNNLMILKIQQMGHRRDETRATTFVDYRRIYNLTKIQSVVNYINLELIIHRTRARHYCLVSDS